MASKKNIPEAALAQHTAILGKTGSGKTSTGKLLIEQVVEDDARVCILDTVKSDWWGLTSSADGKKPGLPFHILGGPRGHVPLHSSAGKAVAEIVASGALRHSIIDMADFEAGGAQRFFVDFAPALLRNMRGVLYLVIEEAHELAPKERSGFDKENMSVHYAKKLATAGRSKGIRLVVLTQRTQSLHNALLGSCETMIVHRLTAPADQEPVLKWLKANASGGVIEMIASQISSLKTGAGWVCSGEAKIFERVEFPRIKTYDNSATPTDDEHRHEVKTAPVDQEKLRTIIGAAVKEAEANDPKMLRAEIAKLKAEAAKRPTEKVLAIDHDAVRAAEKRGYEQGMDYATDTMRAAADAISTTNSTIAKASTELGTIQMRLLNMAAAKPAQIIPKKITQPRNLSAQAPKTAQRASGTEVLISVPQQRILDALAWLASIRPTDPADRTQLAILADQSPKSSGYSNNLGFLRSAGLIDYPSGGTVKLTDSGHAAANAPERAPTTEDLHRTLEQKLPGPQWKILDALISHYPGPLNREELAECALQSATSSGFSNNLGALRSLGFIDYPQPGTVTALPVLFLDG